jgi:hypothetical protein
MIELGLCQCGCGGVTGYAERRERGYKPGDRLRFIQNHNPRWKDNRDVRARILAKRRIDGECWIWTGQIDEHGYGRMSFDGRKQFIHDLSYKDFVGPIPEGLELDHLCRNPPCFNPAHLEPVTQAENARRGRQSKLTHADIILIRDLKEPHTVTALRYGVHPSTICDIRNFRRWNYEGRSS